MNFSKTILFYFILTFSLFSCSRKGGNVSREETTAVEPVIMFSENTSVLKADSTYYFVFADRGSIWACASDTPDGFTRPSSRIICPAGSRYDLQDFYRPVLYRLDGAWYLYVSADDGNTDNHRIYVFENSNSSPFDGEFVLKNRIVTDPDDNFAIHPSVFSHDGTLYMVWSGWQSRRVFAERQCLFIASMSNPWTLGSERVMISSPQYEWEVQWVQKDGFTHGQYPVFVNENPVVLSNDRTDKVYLFYSASAIWTCYSCIGRLEAGKDSDLLKAASWKKNPLPVFAQNPDDGIYGPSVPFFVEDPKGNTSLLYSATRAASSDSRRRIYMQNVRYESGVPQLGVPGRRP